MMYLVKVQSFTIIFLIFYSVIHSVLSIKPSPSSLGDNHKPISFHQSRTLPSPSPLSSVALPNFYAHVVSTRDEYKLIVPEEFRLPNLAARKLPPSELVDQYAQTFAHQRQIFANVKASIDSKNESTNSTNSKEDDGKLLSKDQNETTVDMNSIEFQPGILDQVTTDMTLIALRTLQSGMSSILNNHSNTSSSEKEGKNKTTKNENGETNIKPFIRIGNSTIPPERITPVGDVDGNGMIDFIVSNVGAKGRRGSIRLYLISSPLPSASPLTNEKMQSDKDDSVTYAFLYTRELVPGQWGFNAPPLQPEDKYGSVVAALPTETGSNYSLIASASSRHVYILKLSRRGNVLSHVRLPWPTFDHLVLEYERAAGVPISRDMERDEAFDDQSAFMDAVDSVRTMVFRGPNGAIRAALRVDDSRGRDLLHTIDKFVAYAPISRRRLLWRPMMRIALPQDNDIDHHEEEQRGHVQKNSNKKELDSDIRVGFSIRAGCLFTKTECACELVEEEKNSLSCYKRIGEPDDNGRVLCKPRKCGHSYKCSCEGTNLCSREKRIVTSLTVTSKGEDGKMYCMDKATTQYVSVLVKPNALKKPELPSGCHFTPTECSCGLVPQKKGFKSCFEKLSPSDKQGRIRCERRECGDSYKCSCDGSEMCAREKRTISSLTEVEHDEEGNMFCKEKKIDEYVNVVVTPKSLSSYPKSSTTPTPTPTSSPTPSSSSTPSNSPSPSNPYTFDRSQVDTFNATHCICKPPEPDAPKTSECLHYSHTIEKEAILCRIGGCPADSGYVCDAFGKHYCTRKYVPRNFYVNDGEVDGDPTLLFCHMEHEKRYQILRIS